MKKKENRDINKEIIYREDEIAEDATEYGEFISSYFAWIPPEKQKQKADELDKNTKKKKNKEKKRKIYKKGGKTLKMCRNYI